MKRFIGISLFFAFGLLAFAAGHKESSASPDSSVSAQGSAKTVIAVSILPHDYFVRRIGGDKVSTVVLVGPGQDPHSYDPTPKQMAELAKARAWILSNTDFEIPLKLKVAAQYPSLMLVDGTQGVQFRQIEAHSGNDEPAVPAGGATGMNIDRHTWLGREPAKILASHVRDTLIKTDPDDVTFFDARYKILVAEIDREFDSLVPQLAGLKGKIVFVFHPAFGYFFDEFGIKQEAVETGGKEPTAKALTALIWKARKDQVKTIFVQAQFPVDAARKVAEAVGAQVLPLDPLAPDWLENIRRIGETLKKAYR